MQCNYYIDRKIHEHDNKLDKIENKRYTKEIITKYQLLAKLITSNQIAHLCPLGPSDLGPDLVPENC